MTTLKATTLLLLFQATTAFNLQKLSSGLAQLSADDEVSQVGLEDWANGEDGKEAGDAASERRRWKKPISKFFLDSDLYNGKDDLYKDCECDHCCNCGDDDDDDCCVDCDFDPEVEDCILEELVENNPPGGVGQGDPDQGKLETNLGSTENIGSSSTLEIPDIRQDIYCCTNCDSKQKTGNKSCYSGCRKKIFELSGNICIAETQTGGLCCGDEENCDGVKTCITNKLTKTSDGTVVGNPCPEGCCPCDDEPIAAPSNTH